MAYIKQLTDLDGSTYDLRSKITNGILYGEVDSTSTSTNFTVQIPGVTEYYDGLTILLRNRVVTSASGFTINVNGLGGKPSYNNMTLGNPVTPTNPTRDTTIFNINYAMLFTYNTTVVSTGCWICYRGYDANTNTIGYQLRMNSAPLPVSDTARYYKIYFTSADGTKWVPASVNSTNNATAARDVNQRPINPFGRIVYTSANTNYTAGTNLAVGSAWDQYTLVLGYSFNRTGSALSLTYPKAVYVKCAPQTDGSAIMDATTPIVQDLPNAEDGKIYIFLGIAYDATHIELYPIHPVYYYKNSAIRIWTNAETFTAPVTSVNGETGDVVLSIPSKTSDLTNDSGFITDAGVTSFNGSIGAVTYTAPVTSVNGQTGDVSLSIPSKTSDLTNDDGFITGISSSDVTTALGYTPYNSTNPNGYISGISSSDVTTALGYTPYNSTNPNGYISGISSSDVTTALGYTPYNSTNPNNYVDATGAANAAPVQSVNGQTGAVSLTIPTVPTNVSAFTNDAGYLTLSTLPRYDGSHHRVVPDDYSVTISLTNPIYPSYFTSCYIFDAVTSTESGSVIGSISSASGSTTVSVPASSYGIIIVIDGSGGAVYDSSNVTCTGGVSYIRRDTSLMAWFEVTGDGTITIDGVDYDD